MEVLSLVVNGVCSFLSLIWLLSSSGSLLIIRIPTNYSLCCSIPTLAVNMKITPYTVYGLETNGLLTLESSIQTNGQANSTKLVVDQQVQSASLTKPFVQSTLKDLIWLVVKVKHVIVAWMAVHVKLRQRLKTSSFEHLIYLYCLHDSTVCRVCFTINALYIQNPIS